MKTCVLKSMKYMKFTCSIYCPFASLECWFLCSPMYPWFLAQNEKKVKVKVTQSYPTLCNPMDCPWNSPGQNTGVGSLSLPQGIFPTQGLNPGLLHCRQILYQLRHKGSPRILEWVVFPFPRGSFPPRNRTGVSWIAGRFFTNWAIREAQTDPKWQE